MFREIVKETGCSWKGVTLNVTLAWPSKSPLESHEVVLVNPVNRCSSRASAGVCMKMISPCALLRILGLYLQLANSVLGYFLHVLLKSGAYLNINYSVSSISLPNCRLRWTACE